MSRAMTRDELVEFATFLYGPKWQSPLAKELGIERRLFVRDLASDAPVTENTARIILGLLDARIAEIQQEQADLQSRLDQLKREMELEEPEGAKRDNGREVAS